MTRQQSISIPRNQSTTRGDSQIKTSPEIEKPETLQCLNSLELIKQEKKLQTQ
jgi:hypothetical protein